MSGYPADRFIVPIDDYICVICRDVCKNTCVIECGHIFCHDCIVEAEKQKQECPSCRTPFTDIQTSPWHTSKIKGLEVHCCYKEYCEFTDALHRITEHEAMCDFRPTQCDVCQVHVWHKDHDVHPTTCVKRPEECLHCHETLPWDELECHYKNTCLVILLECPNQCDSTLYLRPDLIHHVTVCHLEKIPCVYQSIGCTELTPRYALPNHECDISFHFPLLIKHQYTQKEEYELQLQKIQDDFYKTKAHYTIQMESMLSLVHKGPEHINDHVHPLELCKDDSTHKCDICHMTINSPNKTVWYRCNTQCDFDVCLVCFSQKRMIKNKIRFRTDAMYRITHPDMDPKDYLPHHPDLESGKVVHSSHPYVHGHLVKRGPSWVWGDQDGHGIGTILKVEDTPGFLFVFWETTRQINRYRAGVGREFDLVYA
jgi:hypothetical protein